MANTDTTHDTKNKQQPNTKQKTDKHIIANHGFMNPNDFPIGTDTGDDVPQVEGTDTYSSNNYKDTIKHDRFLRQAKPDIIGGEDSESGDQPVPDSDDNTLDNAQTMGLYTNADEEHPSPLGIAEEVNIAEKEEREK